MSAPPLLNPNFLAAHGIVPLGEDGARLTLAMADAGDGHAIAAMRFATGRDIAPVPLSGAGRRAEASAPRPRALQLNEAGCSARLPGGDLLTIAADAGQAAWEPLRAAMVGEEPMPVVVARELCLDIVLPTMPRGHAAIVQALDRFAPIVPAALVWTAPRPREAGSCITIAHRAWLAERLAWVEQGMNRSATPMTPDGARFLAAPPARVGAMWLATLAVGGSALALMLASHAPIRSASRQAAVGLLPKPRPAPPIAIAPPPELVGIAGRLPDDGEAIVRVAPDRTRAVRPGDTVAGWTVIAVTATGANFTRGKQQITVSLPLPPPPRRAQ